MLKLEWQLSYYDLWGDFACLVEDRCSCGSQENLCVARLEKFLFTSPAKAFLFLMIKLFKLNKEQPKVLPARVHGSHLEVAYA